MGVVTSSLGRGRGTGGQKQKAGSAQATPHCCEKGELGVPKGKGHPRRGDIRVTRPKGTWLQPGKESGRWCDESSLASRMRGSTPQYYHHIRCDSALGLKE